MAIQIVVLADDLSGAAELGAIGLRFGLTAEVQTDFEPNTSADICLVDTDTRSCTLEAAVQRVAQVARRLIALPPVFVFKKVDSLLRGAVLVETRAIARTLGRQRVILISANPSRGRVIREGRYFVDDVPLDQTPFAADPEYPRQTSDVRQLLDGSSAGRLASRVELGLSEIDVTVPNVTSVQDVAEWANQVGSDTLAAGAADFFSAILAKRFSRSTEPVDPVRYSGSLAAANSTTRTLVVCGSAASWNLRQAEARAAGLPCITAPAEVFAVDRNDAVVRLWGDRIAEGLLTRRCVLVGIGRQSLEEPARSSNQEFDQATAPAAALARRLADAVTHALRRAPVERFLLEGGATAAAIVRRENWNRLAVVGAPGPGVAALTPIETTHGTSPTILVKPGSYPWPERVWKSVVADCIGPVRPPQA